MNKINKLRNIIRKIIQENAHITDKTWLTDDNELIKLEENVKHQDYLQNNTRYKYNRIAVKNDWMSSGNMNGVVYTRMKNLDKNTVDRFDRYVYDYYTNCDNIFLGSRDANNPVRISKGGITEEGSIWKAVYKKMRMQS